MARKNSDFSIKQHQNNYCIVIHNDLRHASQIENTFLKTSKDSPFKSQQSLNWFAIDEDSE